MIETRLHVVSARELVRAGVIGVFEAAGGLQVIGSRAAPLYGPTSADVEVVLFDVESLWKSAPTLHALASDPKWVVLALVHTWRPALQLEALRLGLAGSVGLDWSVERAVSVVRDAGRARREELASPGGDGVLPSGRPGARGEAPGLPFTLTHRESEVLELIAGGLSNTQIASSLFVSTNSVKSHIRSAYSKIGVESRTQAVVWCYEHGVVDASGVSQPDAR